MHLSCACGILPSRKQLSFVLRWTRNANTLDLLLEILWVRRLWSHVYPSSTPIGDPCCSTLNHEQHTNKMPPQVDRLPPLYTARFYASVDKSSNKTR